MSPRDSGVESRSPFTNTAGTGTLVGASVLSADFGRLAQEAADALEAGADLLHIDIMDGHFCPNLSMGPAVCGALRAHLPDAILDVHLMVARPSEYLEPFADAGADHLTVHVEIDEDLQHLAEHAHDLGCTAGVAINPDTPIDRLLAVSDAFDMFLVMSVFPGFSGQKFIEDVLDTTRALRAHRGADAWIEMDGGISPVTASACREAGCNVLVSASAIFGTHDYARAIEALRQA